MTFHAPVNAINYLLRHCAKIEDLSEYSQYADIESELVSDILQGAMDFAAQVLAPINKSGDEYGATLKDGMVLAAPGFKEAYQAYVEAGWQGISVPPDLGGMGLPQVLSVGVNEMLFSANMAFGLAPMLTASSINAIIAHADTSLKDKYLSKMVTGEWSGGMNLTEPQAGSDLGVLRSKAVPNDDGTYSISGQKIFITWGDHDCAENIIHLVLARLPDAPQGSRGISLFLVPKIFVNDDGSLGTRNRLKAIGLEHKLGIHASPTCVMEFDGATGWLVGPENKGLACMFTMMNEARLFVGVQGVAIGERAYQQALSYAGERVQGRVIDEPDGTPIWGHPDVRRMLMDMKAGLMGARAINMATAVAGDMARATDDENIRKVFHAREALLTPIAKAYGSDMGVFATSLGVQIHGGMGFIEETGAAQHYRDSRITPIYEGTNGIQAIDLVGRKLRRDGGQAMAALIEELSKILEQGTVYSADNGLDFETILENARAGLDLLRWSTEIVLKAPEKDALASADAYLGVCGDVISGVLLLNSVTNGYKAGDPHAKSMHGLARHHAVHILARAAARREQIKKGAAPVFALGTDHLADL
ncbi:MAG TPA: acyl-CoA dehydrogenase [Hellea balneolensis]|uniref:3-methylmercaptopropionyl-CoA dehydrogenase n=1 Tax=Hellea balneolensis TaxID=287478 RepID=A0A7C5QN70_9PROT|nr:acyl-CoA dehydrogenase [Hellea balneolensis]